jgi:3-oxoacyl-[acyl-carrier protein] reductase
MDLQLGGKAAIVLGATRGIGRAIAELLAEEGADVGICARDARQVGEAVKALSARGAKAFGRAVDIADGAALKAFVAEAGENLGGIDILVCNASARVRETSAEAWRTMIETDLLGAVNAFEASRAKLEAAAAARGDAAVVLIASVAAAEADGASAYAPMKAALVHYAKGLARELAPKQVRVNVVSPGHVLFEGGTWAIARDQNPDLYAELIALNPTGRMGTPEEIAAAAVFLASSRSSFTTGANLVVDGTITVRVGL